REAIPIKSIRSETTFLRATTITVPVKVNVATTTPPTIGSIVPVAAQTTAGIREKYTPPRDQEAIFPGVIDMKLARAWKGIRTCGNSDLSAPGLSGDVSGINQRTAASIIDRASRTIKPNCSGADRKSG